MISVIVPIYHGKSYIEAMVRQVEEAAKHVDKTIELLLVNDAPEDFIDSISSEIVDIQVINTEINRGIHGARVRGLKRAKGEYILFLDQDDVIEPLYFSSQLSCIGNFDGVVCRILHGGKLGYSKDIKLGEIINLECLISQGNAIRSPGQVLIRKRAIPNVWIENVLEINGADDWLLWITMMKQGSSLNYNDEVLFEHVVHGNNASCNELAMSNSEKEVFKILNTNKILSKYEEEKFSTLLEKQNENRLRLYEKCIKKAYLYESWLEYHRCGNLVGKFCLDKGATKVAIYGAGEIGDQIKRELAHSNIDVVCFVDQNAKNIKKDTPVVTLEEMTYQVDLAIVSLIENQNRVKELVEKTLGVQVYTISEIVEMR